MKYITILVALALVSCDKKNGNDVQSVNLNSKDVNVSAIDGVIDGSAWTISDLSDFFDEGLTVEQAISAFGDTPLKRVNGDEVQLVYEILSDKLYFEGVRISTLSITFKDNKIINSEIGFMHVEEL